jgi:hypothetical protein
MRTRPDGLGPAGAALYDATVTAYTLQPHELEILAEAARVADLLARLRAQVDSDGVLVPDHAGGQRVHPALVESRLQGILLAKLIVALRLPLDDTSADPHRVGRTQHRGLRGIYGGA